MCIKAKIASYGFAEGALPEAENTSDALLLLAKRFVALIFDPEVVAMHRVVQAEAANYPRIAALFYESGPGATKRAVGATLEVLVELGALRIDDIEYAAWQLPNMAMGSFRVRLEFGIIDHVPEDALDAHLRRVVDDFMTLYGTRSRA